MPAIEELTVAASILHKPLAGGEPHLLFSLPSTPSLRNSSELLLTPPPLPIDAMKVLPSLQQRQQAARTEGGTGVKDGDQTCRSLLPEFNNVTLSKGLANDPIVKLQVQHWACYHRRLLSSFLASANPEHTWEMVTAEYKEALQSLYAVRGREGKPDRNEGGDGLPLWVLSLMEFRSSALLEIAATAAVPIHQGASVATADTTTQKALQAAQRIVWRLLRVMDAVKPSVILPSSPYCVAVYQSLHLRALRTQLLLLQQQQGGRDVMGTQDGVCSVESIVLRVVDVAGDLIAALELLRAADQEERESVWPAVGGIRRPCGPLASCFPPIALSPILNGVLLSVVEILSWNLSLLSHNDMMALLHLAGLCVTVPHHRAPHCLLTLVGMLEERKKDEAMVGGEEYYCLLLVRQLAEYLKSGDSVAFPFRHMTPRRKARRRQHGNSSVAHSFLGDIETFSCCFLPIFSASALDWLYVKECRIQQLLQMGE